eukprot:GGOE01021592.1.p1 GENE.GGOE01021592.1~~GGOE01021592.1.p1  ORF type:complete len:1109 (-),score=317.47 GGOE01021592.1:437-3628(-)
MNNAATQFAERQQQFGGMTAYIKSDKNDKKPKKAAAKAAPSTTLAPPTSPLQPVEKTSPISDEKPKAFSETKPTIKDNQQHRGNLSLISLKTNKDVVDALHACLAMLESQKGRATGTANLKAICKARPDDKFIEPFALAGLPNMLPGLAGSKSTMEVVLDAAIAIIKHCSPHSTERVLEVLFQGLKDYKWQVKMGCLSLLATLAGHAPSHVGRCSPDVILALGDQLQDTKPEVRAAAMEAFDALWKTVITNPDVQPIMPVLLKAYLDPVSETQTALDKLMETTFVSTVDTPTLAVLCPVLRRGMLERQSEWKRKSAIIINNMCKLVVDPRAAAQFFPILEPVLAKNADEVVFEVVKNMCQQALDTLTEVTGTAHANLALDVTKDELLAVLMDDIGDRATEENRVDYSEIFEFIVDICLELLRYGMAAESDWQAATVPYLNICMSKIEALEVCRQFQKHSSKWLIKMERQHKGAEEDICNVDFSLAYGGKILLHNARLWLKRGHRYGLVGQNGIGKTTLMRSIANRQVEGLPEQLNTVFVQSAIDVSHLETCVLDYVRGVEGIRDNSTPNVLSMLDAVGFETTMHSSPISSLSGGWRMRLALACAMLQKPDLLLLDEPTNHLDEAAVAWLTSYLRALKGVTCLIVSHSSTFANNVCTDIVHFVDQKLHRFSGTLEQFVEAYPETRFHFDLSASQLVYKFPPPGKLEGVKSRNRQILRLQSCSFTYEGNNSPTLRNVSISLTLGSRVAVTGPNGAGKSTLIKLIVGEEEPNTGDYFKHHNLRMAYVAQHTFHHLEEHLPASPVAYFQHRFAQGQDKELLQKKSLKLTAAEEAMVGKELGQVEKILSRRTRHKELEYEVKWVGRPEKDNKYLTRATLEKMGYLKLVQQADEKVALEASGADLRALTTEEIQSHLNDFGLPQEFGTYGKISGLSGGQKVKLVLAAALWNAPHLLILDEPTNFLDKESLGAFANALQGFGGGIIMISHDKEFYSLVCPEVWEVAGGMVRVKGESGTEDQPLAMQKRKEEILLDSKEVAGGNLNVGKVSTVPTDFWGRPLSKKEMRKRK